MMLRNLFLDGTDPFFFFGRWPLGHWLLRVCVCVCTVPIGGSALSPGREDERWTRTRTLERGWEKLQATARLLASRRDTVLLE